MFIIVGEEYLNATVPLQILGIAVIFAILGGAFTSCLNIPLGREMVNMKATILSAVANIVLNLFFIPKFKQNGAAITTVISEFIVFGYCFITFPKKSEFIDLKSWAKTFAQALIGSILILVLAAVLKQVFTGALVRLLVILPTAILVYGIGLLLCRNSYIYAGIDLIYRKWKV